MQVVQHLMGWKISLDGEIRLLKTPLSQEVKNTGSWVGNSRSDCRKFHWLKNLFWLWPHALITTSGWNGAERTVNPQVPPSITEESISPQTQGWKNGCESLTALAIEECRSLLDVFEHALIASKLPLLEGGFELADAKDKALHKLNWHGQEQSLARWPCPEDQEMFWKKQ